MCNSCQEGDYHAKGHPAGPPHLRGKEMSGGVCEGVILGGVLGGEGGEMWEGRAWRD